MLIELLVPGGFGDRGTEGKIDAIGYARMNKIPFFGICLMELAAIEYARHVGGIEKAGSSESDPDCPAPVIDLLREQRHVRSKGATMRLGAFPCTLQAGTIAADAYGTLEISERHRHRYEFNNEYRAQLSEAGLILSGTSPDKKLVEMIELADHPYFVGCQLHPEFKSRPVSPQLLVRALREGGARSQGSARTIERPAAEGGAEHHDRQLSSSTGGRALHRSADVSPQPSGELAVS